MGERDPQAPMWSYRVNLDKRVRSDHPLRQINEVLDLSFVRGQVAHIYGRRGNKSVPPEASAQRRASKQRPKNVDSLVGFSLKQINQQ